MRDTAISWESLYRRLVEFFAFLPSQVSRKNPLALRHRICDQSAQTDLYKQASLSTITCTALPISNGKWHIWKELYGQIGQPLSPKPPIAPVSLLSDRRKYSIGAGFSARLGKWNQSNLSNASRHYAPAMSRIAASTISRALSRSDRPIVSGGDRVKTHPCETLKLSPALRHL